MPVKISWGFAVTPVPPITQEPALGGLDQHAMRHFVADFEQVDDSEVVGLILLAATDRQPDFVHRSCAEFMEQPEQHVASIELDKLLALLLRQVFYARMLRHEPRVVSYAEPELAHVLLGGRSQRGGRLVRGGWGRWRCLLGCLGAHRCGADDESGKCPTRCMRASQRA